MIYVAILIVAVLLVLVLRRDSADYIPPVPTTKRTDLHSGYYGSTADQFDATKDHITLHWFFDWYPLEQLISELQANPKVALVHDFGAQLFERRALRLDAQALVMARLQRLHDAGVLGRMAVAVPCDEPNHLTKGLLDPEDLPRAMAILRECCGQFPELAGVMFGVVFAYNAPMLHPELFDIVGVDNYPARTNVLRPGGEYDQMRAQLRPDQRTWLVPGVAYGQTPIPFANFAHSHPEVWGLVLFSYLNPPDDPQAIGMGDARNAGMAEICRALGKELNQPVGGDHA